MASQLQVTGLILAGGAGRRVGSRDKGLIEWRGKPLVAHVVERLRPQVDELLISCNRNVQQYRALAPTVVDNRGEFQGPLAGLEAAASHIATEVLVVVACDIPLLPGDLVARLTEALHISANGAAEICYAHDGQRGQYLCAAIRRECTSSLGFFLDQGHRAVRRWYQSRHSMAVDFSDQAESFRNYNYLD